MTKSIKSCVVFLPLQAYNLKKYFRTFVLHLLPLDFAANGGPSSADVEKDDNKENQEIKKEENKDPKQETKTCAILPETLKLFAVSDYPSTTNEETASDDSVATRGPVRIDFCRLCGDVVKQDAESLNSHYESTHATERDKLVRTWSQQVSFHPCTICGHKPETMRSVKVSLKECDIVGDDKSKSLFDFRITLRANTACPSRTTWSDTPVRPTSSPSPPPATHASSATLQCFTTGNSFLDPQFFLI